MVRILAFASILFLASFSRASFEDNARHGLIEHRAVGDDRITRVSDAVRTRFLLDAAVARCDFAENLYAYRMLLERFSGETRRLIEAAADAGRHAARTDASDVVSGEGCGTAVDRLRAADDRLLALSEVVSRN